MATRSPTESHSYWGSFADFASLPAGDPRLESGDTAYAQAEASLYVYDGAAWNAVGGGGCGGPTGSVTTTDATPTTMITLTPDASSTTVYEATVAAKKQGEAAGAGYSLVGSFVNQGGSLYQIGSTQVVATQETVPSTNAAFVVSGTDVLLQVTGESAPVEIAPSPVPPPSGATINVAAPGTDVQINAAIAAASPGDRILLAAGTFTLASTVTVNKAVTIEGSGIGATFIDTAYSSSAPVTMIQVTVSNVVIRDLCVRHRKTTNTSVEAAISFMVANNGTAAGSSGHYLEAVRVEYMEFAVLVRSDGWQINGCEFAYVGGNNSTRRVLGIYRSAGQGIFANSTYDTAQSKVFDSGTSTGGNTTTTLNDTAKTWTASQWIGYTVTITGGTGSGQTRTVSANTTNQLTVSAVWATTPDATSTYTITATGNTRIVQVTSTTGTAEEVIGGYLRVSNITPSPAYPLHQFFNLDSFIAAPTKLQLVVDNCVTNETSAFIVFYTTTAQPSLTRLASVLLKNNTLANASGKGAFALDGASNVGPLAVLSATSNTLTASGTSWTVNTYVGQSVVITGGLGAGQVRTVVGNTATTLSVSTAWTTAPDATSTFAIANLASPGTTSFYASGNALTNTTYTAPFSSGVTPSGGAAIDALLGYYTGLWTDPNQPVSNPAATTWDWTGTVCPQIAP